MRQIAINRILKHTTAWTEEELNSIYPQTKELIDFSLQIEKAIKFIVL